MHGLRSDETEGYDESSLEPQEGDQGEHSDYDLEVLRELEEKDRPLAGLYAVEPDTRLRIRPYGGACRRRLRPPIIITIDAWGAERYSCTARRRCICGSICLLTRSLSCSCAGGWIHVVLQPGDLLFFAGDLCHNGLGYARRNHRVHFYIHSPAYDKKSIPSAINPCAPSAPTLSH